MSLFARLFGSTQLNKAQANFECDQREYTSIARIVWTLCHEQPIHQAADRLREVVRKSKSPGTQLRLMALSKQLGESGFQVAAIACDQIIQQASLTQRLTERVSSVLQWNLLMDPYPEGITDRNSEGNAFAQMFLRRMRADLISDNASQVLISGPLAHWIMQWPADRIARELRTDHEVRVYPTTDFHEALQNLTDIRNLVLRDPAKRNLFVAPIIGCPWFPFVGPPSATTSIFPSCETQYVARVYMYGMPSWAYVLDSLAANSAGAADVYYRWYVIEVMDPRIPTAARRLLDSAKNDQERVAIIARASHDILDSERKRHFNFNLHYTGTFEDMIARVDRAFEIAQTKGKATEDQLQRSIDPVDTQEILPQSVGDRARTTKTPHALARELSTRHGGLLAVKFVSGPPNYEVHFEFKDGTLVTSGMQHGQIVGLFAFGYSGTAPSNLWTFLRQMESPLALSAIAKAKCGTRKTY